MEAWQANAMPILLAGLLVLVPVLLILAVAPVVAGVSLLFRLTGRRAPDRPVPAERMLRRPLSTGALVAWLVIPLLVIGLWASADALTEDRGSTPSAVPAQPALRTGGVPGVWKASGGATVIFAADGYFRETGLPNLHAGGPAIPQSGTGTWRLYGSGTNFDAQDVVLRFSSGASLDLTVTWQPASSGRGHFVLNSYLGSSGNLVPSFQLIRQAAPPGTRPCRSRPARPTGSPASAHRRCPPPRSTATGRSTSPGRTTALSRAAPPTTSC
jgi:hypothetical protein